MQGMSSPTKTSYPPLTFLLGVVGEEKKRKENQMAHFFSAVWYVISNHFCPRETTNKMHPTGNKEELQNIISIFVKMGSGFLPQHPSISKRKSVQPTANLLIFFSVEKNNKEQIPHTNSIQMWQRTPFSKGTIGLLVFPLS